MELPPSTQPGRAAYSSSSSLLFPRSFPQPWRCRVWLLLPLCPQPCLAVPIPCLAVPIPVC